MARTRRLADGFRAGYHATVRTAAVLFLVLATACGGAYSDAIKRGDRYAAAGKWAEAEAEYQRAMKLDPDDPEAQLKLEELRARQARSKLEHARALEARGELAAALEEVQGAHALRPDDAAIDQELTRLSGVVLERAHRLLEKGDTDKAFALTTLVLKGAPQHPAARRLDREIRERIATDAYEKAQELVEKDLPGNALAELARALDARPGFPEAKLEYGRIELSLERQLAFVVAVAPFDGEGQNRFLARALTPVLLGKAMDDRLLVKVVRAEDSAGSGAGIGLVGRFDRYGFRHGRQREQRSCDYVCGTDVRPNPRRGEVERSLGQAESGLASDERRVAQAEKDVSRAEGDVANQQKRVDSEQADVDRAQERYDRCMEHASADDSSPCSSERSSLESERRQLESARSSLRSPQGSLQRARDSLQRARDSRNRSRETVERQRATLRSTPTTIEVPRMCAFSYQVAKHAVESSVTLKLTMSRRRSETLLLDDQPFQYRVDRSDETHPAHPGRCPEVAAGDPLELPDEAALRRELLGRVIADLRAKIMASYDTYRAHYLAVARKYHSGGMREQAVEAYVRYVLTGPERSGGAEALRRFLAKEL